MEILIADDSKSNLAMLTSILTKLGHTVIQAHNGKESIDLFREKRPDLIILDVVMPGLDGFQTAKIIREIDDINWIPIIFLSATVDDQSIANGIDAGGDDYLTKPCSDITLAAKIKAMERIAEMRQKLFETTQRLYLLSSTDPLTGIYNRLQFDRSINEILAAADHFGHNVALLFIDIDNFKYINDNFGHNIGDLLLVEVARRLKACIRASDFLARLGGDEFAIILSEVNNKKEAEEIAQNIIQSIATEYHLENRNIRSSASIGIAYYPEDSSNKENLVLNADVAMYHAKATGRNNCKIFSSEIHRKYRHHINIEQALKFALERKELFLNYQPIFNLQTKRITGVEILLCWDNPKYNLVSPNVFIPIAEETGLISHIGNWALWTACHQIAQWGLNKNSNIKFAFNISSRQIMHEDFYYQVMDIINETKIPTNILQFELTETAIMTYNEGTFRTTINKLHELGLMIAIDDFGTGYSSLIRLRRLPIDAIKIEKSFVHDAVTDQNGAIIVKCIIALGKNLGIDVVAEGIENKNQFDFLVEHQCPQGQGYYLSKPLSIEQMDDLLKRKKLEKV